MFRGPHIVWGRYGGLHVQVVISNLQQDIHWRVFLQFYLHVLFQSKLLMVVQWVLLWLPPIVAGGFGSSLCPQTIESTITNSSGAISSLSVHTTCSYKRGGRLQGAAVNHAFHIRGVDWCCELPADQSLSQGEDN